jgi:hypothetical protein
MPSPNSFVQTILLEYMNEHGVDPNSEEGRLFFTSLGLLQTPGSGGSGTPGGLDTQVQFNDAGAFGGNDNFQFDKTNAQVVIGDTLNNWSGASQLTVVSNPPNLENFNQVIDAEGILTDGIFGGHYTAVVGKVVASGATSGSILRMFEAFGGSNTANLMQQLVGYYVQLRNTNGGEVTMLTGVEVDRPSANNGSITTSNGLYVHDISGIATNNYGLHIANQGTGSTDYAIKVDGGKNDLGPGQLLVGPGDGAMGVQAGAITNPQNLITYIASDDSGRSVLGIEGLGDELQGIGISVQGVDATGINTIVQIMGNSVGFGGAFLATSGFQAGAPKQGSLFGVKGAADVIVPVNEAYGVEARLTASLLASQPDVAAGLNLIVDTINIPNAYGVKVSYGSPQNDLGTGPTSVGKLLVTTPTVPNSSSATGVAGTIAWDASFIYVCIATNTWKRTAISTW